MSKHTPGPWTCERDASHYDTLSTVVAGDEWQRKGISRQMIVQVGGWAEWREQEANARLIAAAPELLEVAKQMAQAFKAIPHGEWPSLDLCRAAIAKAEGGQDE